MLGPGLTAVGCGERPEPVGPNVVIISIDGLRPDHLGCYGHRRNTSPVIDAFARGGALFESHISSAPTALPAHVSLLTGTGPGVHGVHDATSDALPPGIETLAESFRAAGYATGAFFTSAELESGVDTARGFERHRRCGDPEQSSGAAEHVHRAWTRFLEAAGPGARAGRAPIFALLNLSDVRPDFEAPAPYDSMFDPDYRGPITGRNVMGDGSIGPGMADEDRYNLIARYDGEVRWTDAVVGRVHDDLVDAGLIDDTIVVLTSGHGLELFDHGGKGAGTTLLDEQIHVPFILWYPAAVPRGRYGVMTRTIDVAPTLLELAGQPSMPSATGQSFARVATGEAAGRNQVLAVSELFTRGRALRSVRSGSDKIVHSVADDSFTRYDLVLDPAETTARPVGQDARSQALLAQYRGAVGGIEAARRALGLSTGPAGEGSATEPPIGR